MSSRTQAIENFIKEEKNFWHKAGSNGAMKGDYRMKGRKRKVPISSGITHFQSHYMLL